MIVDWKCQIKLLFFVAGAKRRQQQKITTLFGIFNQQAFGGLLIFI